ncbi:type II toxin-antitoxin system prevent-host-death family antitoxin [Nocardia cyriacigeorgica]|uniref:Antitoxin n=1 Tax=Nocardia cyriacigeorgica TaxID=135487 RepID=A0A5R8P926_9NOCA|nr:type II toxin-antitoxin system prevent-host-death family antitoxin [Nocardia cyriacigeorgica]TLG03256.1 type II toxin-antitoxin system prevent-host-death family antitoxin [Nocardia cyriacigeorgica]
MRIQTYSETRARLAETLSSIIDDQDEVVITRAGKEPVVMLPLAEYESIKETAYLLRSPANARRLREAIARVEAGEVEQHELIDE